MSCESGTRRTVLVSTEVPLIRLHFPLTPEHLRFLADVAEEERDAFFARNPQAGIYEERFLAAALCQGAALHYLGCGNGVKDFDIHFFYSQHPLKKRLSRTVKSMVREIPGFGSRRIDFIRTIVPTVHNGSDKHAIVEELRGFLRAGRTANAGHLAEKAVIGLLPKSVFKIVIWPEAGDSRSGSAGSEL